MDGPLDLDTARRYADPGVHRLVIQPHATADVSTMDDLITSTGDLLIDRV
jgi:hypothetical protein